MILVDGDIAGFDNLYGCEFGTVCRIWNVIISSEYRRRASASRLAWSMIEISFAGCDAERVDLAYFNTNLAGLLLYHKLGFRHYDIEGREGPDGKPLALIQFRLNRDNEV